MIWWVLGAALLCWLAYLYMIRCGRTEQRWLSDWYYAHRGLHNAERPENTMPAFEAACEAGYGIELDVHLSRDGEVVVIHDHDLQRLAGRPEEPEDLTAAELAGLRILGSEYGAPKLTEVLEMVNGRVPVLLELKNRGFAGPLEEATASILKDYGGKCAVQSFSPFAVRWFMRHEPRRPRGQLSCLKSLLETGVHWLPLFMARHLLSDFVCRPTFISYCKQYLDTWVVRHLRRRGVPVLAWTVKSIPEAQAAAPYCDTIIFQDFDPRAVTLDFPAAHIHAESC
ncbi:MAG: glycerophosphodiester phosphodiesterase [Clostridia bacterium]|nr:glycerophosphodiester phosphodiesterase [Clostridia bacterium]